MTTTIEQIDGLRDRIRESEHINADDKEALLAFSNEMEFLDTEYGDLRHIKLLQHCIVLAGDSPKKYDASELPGVQLVDTFDDEESVKVIGRWIKRQDFTVETKRDYRVALRMFGRHATPGHDIPEPLQLLSAGTPRNYNPMPDPAKMLWWDEHIMPMVENASHLRDKALITVAWDSGARSDEFCSLRVGDVSDHKYGLTLSVDGKTGERSFVLISSVPYLRQWLSVHPGRGDPTAPLWSKLDSPEDPSYRMKLKILKKAAKKAGVDHTDITFRRMRKSSASFLATENVNQFHIEKHHGWERGSDVVARYIAVFGEASDREIARAHGVDIQEEERDPLAPLTCPRCRQDTPRNEPSCVWCGQAMEHGVVEQFEENQRVARAELLRVAQDEPKLLDELTRFEQLVDFLDANPRVVRDARAFVGELAD